jgi:hypothetical protein
MLSRQALVVWLAAGLAVIGVAKATQAALRQAPSEQVVSLGTSVQGRTIEAVRLGDPTSPNKAMVVGVIHGEEPAGLQVTAALKRDFPALTGVDLWVIDTVNPDGLSADRRTNAHGVDLNRNFAGPGRGKPKPGKFNPGPSPFSEPESRTVRDLVDEIRPQLSIWFHQPWDAVLRDPCHGPNQLQERYARLAGMKTSCRGADIHGTAIGWEKRTFPGSQAMVVELPHGKLTPAAAARQARAVVAVSGGA